MSRVKSFFLELKRRRVYAVGAAYAATAWVISMGAAELFPYFGIPDWGVRLVVGSAILGFPIALVLAWAFEVTPAGIVKDAHARQQAPVSDATTIMPGTPMTLTFEVDGSFRREVVTTPVIIGRGLDCPIRIDNPRVSRQHARLFLQIGHWLVEDLGSSNGTYLDGKEVTGPTPVSGTSELRLAADGPRVRLSVPDDLAATITSTEDAAKS